MTNDEKANSTPPKTPDPVAAVMTLTFNQFIRPAPPMYFVVMLTSQDSAG
jgi:hypothetical protein